MTARHTFLGVKNSSTEMVDLGTNQVHIHCLGFVFFSGKDFAEFFSQTRLTFVPQRQQLETANQKAQLQSNCGRFSMA